ncbi:MAG: major capsid protein [Treponema sp.]|nr:major capsid protein [Treponema sp.]
MGTQGTNTTTSNGAQRTQIAPIETILPKSRFFSSYFMGGVSEHLPSAEVEWDYFTKASPLAHFVGDGLTVPATERGTFKTAKIETPRYQHRKVLGLKDMKNRLPGEPHGSMPASMFKTLEERAARLRFEDDVECVEAVADMRELVTAKFITEGVVQVKGYGVDREIDYNLPNRIVLLGSDQAAFAADPFTFLRTWISALKRLGFRPTEAIMSPEIWRFFEANEKWIAQLNNLRIEKGSIDPLEEIEYGAPAYMGQARDPFLKFYTQESEYYDIETKTMKRHLPEGSLILTTPEARRNRFVYGSIDYMENGQFRSVSGEFIREEWHDDRAATSEILVTSRAVPIPANTNSWLVATVM